MSARKLINYRWTDWVEHDGKGCPFPDGLAVECDLEGERGDFELGMGLTGADGGVSWDASNWCTTDDRGFCTRRVKAYRVKLVSCPALTDRADTYEAAFEGLVPVLIRLPGKSEPDRSFVGQCNPSDGVLRTYPCWVDRYGNVTVVFGSGKQLILKSDQFEVLAAFNPENGHVERTPKLAPHNATGGAS